MCFPSTDSSQHLLFGQNQQNPFFSRRNNLWWWYFESLKGKISQTFSILSDSASQTESVLLCARHGKITVLPFSVNLSNFRFKESMMQSVFCLVSLKNGWKVCLILHPTVLRDCWRTRDLLQNLLVKAKSYLKDSVLDILTVFSAYMMLLLCSCWIC